VPIQALATCHCIEPAIRQAYDHSGVIAMVQIQVIEPLPDGGVRAEAEVFRAWKGNLQKMVTFVARSGCDYPVAPGEEHLLYFTIEDGDRLETARCRGNRPVAESAVSLHWLNRFGQVGAIAEESDR